MECYGHFLRIHRLQPQQHYAGHRDPTTPSRFNRFQLEIVNKISARHRDFTTPGCADQFHFEIVTNLPKTQQTPLLVTRFDPSLSFLLISPHFQPSRHTFITNNTHFHPSSNTSTRLGPPSLISEPLPAPFTNFYQFHQEKPKLFFLHQ